MFTVNKKLWLLNLGYLLAVPLTWLVHIENLAAHFEHSSL